jgi:L-lactate utilization protein LutC
MVRGLEGLSALLQSDLPSAVAIVTGPSRPADIEQTLVVGVHAPREVRVRLRSTS